MSIKIREKMHSVNEPLNIDYNLNNTIFFIEITLKTFNSFANTSLVLPFSYTYYINSYMCERTCIYYNIILTYY